MSLALIHHVIVEASQQNIPVQPKFSRGCPGTLNAANARNTIAKTLRIN